MTKQEVIELLGNPVSVASPGPNQEYLNYRFSETGDDAWYGQTTPYYVLIENGRVRQYGRHGDFGITDEDPTVRVITEGDNDTAMERMQRELRALKELYDEGILTKEEYDRKKKDILNKY